MTIYFVVFVLSNTLSIILAFRQKDILHSIYSSLSKRFYYYMRHSSYLRTKWKKSIVCNTAFSSESFKFAIEKNSDTLTPHIILNWNGLVSTISWWEIGSRISRILIFSSCLTSPYTFEKMRGTYRRMNNFPLLLDEIFYPFHILRRAMFVDS